MNYQNFKLLLEDFVAVSKDTLKAVFKQPGNTLAHFSDSETFPPSRTTGHTAYNAEMAGSQIGRSVSKMRNALFFWYLRDLELVDNNKLKISGLFKKRKYIYLTHLLSTAKVVRVSTYSKENLEKDLRTLKEAGYSVITTNRPVKGFNEFEFTDPKSNLEFSSKLNLSDVLRAILGEAKFNELTDTVIPNDSRKIRIRLIPETIRQQLYLLLTKEVQKYIVYSDQALSKDEVTYFNKFPEIKTTQKVNVNATLHNILNHITLDPKTLVKPTYKPEYYISLVKDKIKTLRGYENIDLDIPAFTLWLTILFFSLSRDNSWLSLWDVLGYQVFIDDDLFDANKNKIDFKVIPGFELQEVGTGLEPVPTRIDNEGTQVIVFDTKALAKVVRINVNDIPLALQPDKI